MSKQIINKHRINPTNNWRKISLLLLFPSFLCYSSLLLAATEDGRWHAGIGDPTVFGWITVFVYLIAVVSCWFKAVSLKKISGNYHFWLYVAVFLLMLGINKQLDLQSWFTQTLKDSAQLHGWYERRRPLQILFIASLGIGMMITLISLRLFLANSWRENKLTWSGIVLLCTFILMRAASFHHLDIFINEHILGLTINVILENGAILLIILDTLIKGKRS